MNLETNSGIYDWNLRGKVTPLSTLNTKKRVYIHDETFRDGSQAAGINRCNLQAQLSILRLMNDMGIDRANVGFPISSKIQVKDISKIARVKEEEGWNMELMCASRIVPEDVQGIIDISQKTGVKIWVGTFLGGSELRAKVMGWDLNEMAKKISAPIVLARRYNLPVMFVTEDTSRSHPDTLQLYYQNAIDAGANQLCVCDTVGFADSEGTRALIHFIKNEIVKNQTVDGKPVEIEFHGHNHRGLALANTLAAIDAGATGVESTLMGIGEMTGNCPTEDIVLNAHLKDLGKYHPNLLKEAMNIYADAIGIKIPNYWRVAGKYAYATGSGVHADAILKAFEMGEPELAALVYSGHDPKIVGRSVDAYVGQTSGRSSVILAFLMRGIQNLSWETIDKIVNAAKKRRTALTEKELFKLAGIPSKSETTHS